MSYASRLLRQNKLDSALYYATHAEEATGRNGNLDLRNNLNNLLAQIYSSKKQYEQAYSYQTNALRLKDSLSSMEQSQQVSNLTFNEHQHELDLNNEAVTYQNR